MVWKLANLCISDQCIRLVHQPNAIYQIYTNIGDITLKCFGKNMTSSGSTIYQD